MKNKIYPKSTKSLKSAMAEQEEEILHDAQQWDDVEHLIESEEEDEAQQTGSTTQVKTKKILIIKGEQIQKILEKTKTFLAFLFTIWDDDKVIIQILPFFKYCLQMCLKHRQLELRKIMHVNQSLMKTVMTFLSTKTKYVKLSFMDFIDLSFDEDWLCLQKKT